MGRQTSTRNALKPHCVSQNGRLVASRTRRLKMRPACSRRQGWCRPIKLRSSAREPKAMSILPSAIGSINFGVSSNGVERSASEKRPIGLCAASNPERTAAPLPRFGKSSSNRMLIFASEKTSRVMVAVASVDPSFTTINSLSGLTLPR